MLQRIALKNIKVFDESGVTINPGKITVLIGANGTGKSTILQTLLLLKQSLNQSVVRYDGSLINIGSFKDLVHAQDVSHYAHIGLSVSYDNVGFPEGMKPHLASSGTFDYDITVRDNSSIYSVAIGGQEGDQLIASSGLTGTALNHDYVVLDDAAVQISPSNTIGSPLSLISPPGGMPSHVHDMTTRISILFSSINRMLSNYFLVPAIRGFDSLAYNILSTEYPADLNAAGGPESQAALVANVIASEPDRADEVASRLQTILHNTSRLRYRNERGRLVSEMANARKSINLVNEAFGLNQLVAPLLWLGKVPRGSIIGIEEPEIHLHPKAQAALCDLFVDIAANEQKQLVLTTHSEHILMGLLAAVANGRLQPDDLAVYEFRRDGDTASAERLAVNQYGQIEGGLKGFLEVDLDEIDELIKARFRPSQA